VQVEGDEWSYGYCPRGTGVFACAPKENPMYSYRESVVLGVTTKEAKEVKEIINKLKKEWPGTKYDLLKANCNHFCEELCKELQVGPFPCESRGIQEGLVWRVLTCRCWVIVLGSSLEWLPPAGYPNS